MALRAAALLLSADGQSAVQVGKTLSVTPRAVHAWRRRWREEGVQALEAREHPGRPSRLSAAAVELLLKDVRSDPREQGYAFARWTCARLAAHLEQYACVRVSPAWVGEVLRRHGFAWRRTKLTLKGLADEEEKSARPKAPQRSEKASLQAGGALRAVVRGRSEVRPVALGALRLAPPGRALSTAHPGQERARGSGGRGALPDGDFRFAHQPKSVTTALFLAVLQTLLKRAKRTERRIVLVLDNGGCFTSRTSRAAIEAAAPHVHIFWLPRYSSETLNWIEGFWQELKSTYFSRMLTADRDSFYAQAVRLLRRIRRRGKLPTRAATPERN
ncbi:MAG TPA: IS630 family transposase [Myxococcaceae bacterium]